MLPLTPNFNPYVSYNIRVVKNQLKRLFEYSPSPPTAFEAAKNYVLTSLICFLNCRISETFGRWIGRDETKPDENPTYGSQCSTAPHKDFDIFMGLCRADNFQSFSYNKIQFKLLEIKSNLRSEPQNLACVSLF